MKVEHPKAMHCFPTKTAIQLPLLRPRLYLYHEIVVKHTHTPTPYSFISHSVPLLFTENISLKNCLSPQMHPCFFFFFCVRCVWSDWAERWRASSDWFAVRGSDSAGTGRTLRVSNIVVTMLTAPCTLKLISIFFINGVVGIVEIGKSTWVLKLQPIDLTQLDCLI